MAALTGAREEFIARARQELAKIETLPVTERDAAWTEVYGGGAIRNLADLPEFRKDWMEAPSNASVSLEYLKRNPAPTVNQLDLQYELDVDGGELLLEVAGERGGDESQFRVAALLAGQERGTMLFWVRVKKTLVAGTGETRVSQGRVSAAGTGKTKVQGPRVGVEVTLRGIDRADMRVTVLDYNLRRGILYARPEK